MIAFIQGKLVDKSPTRVTIDVDGVGFELSIPVSTYERLEEPGTDVMLLTHLHVREDALILIGFSSAEEKELFQMLISVSGIGVKLALGIISGCQSSDLYRYIVEGNESALVRIPGLGKKTAQRMIVDLKDKVASRVTGIAQATGVASKIRADLTEETLHAMVSLGYGKAEAMRAIEMAARGDKRLNTVEDLLRAALKVRT